MRFYGVGLFKLNGSTVPLDKNDGFPQSPSFAGTWDVI
ncbi:MAG: hypothetical protein H6Q00_2107, partial [Holophagaceae bacterium]|nr:hypothetical protein [Holophagaceae bacterium]